MNPTDPFSTTLQEEPLPIVLNRVLPGLQEVEVHVRNESQSTITLNDLDVAWLVHGCGLSIPSVN
jgi:hypothetical protein